MPSVEVDLNFGVWRNDGPMPYLVTILITLLLTVPSMSVELFRYRGGAKDGGTFEYVFDAGEQNSPDTVTKNKSRTQRIS